MGHRGCAAIIVCGLLAVACAGVAQRPGAEVPLRAAVINDPEFSGIKAFTVNIPSTWHFQGTVIADLGCNLPSPVFRAYSPDGLTEIRLLPSFSWLMLEGRAAGPERLSMSRLCIELHGPMTARQFLKRYLRTLDSPRVLGPLDSAAGYRRQLDQLRRRMNPVPSKGTEARSRTTADAAAVRIETTNGTFTIRERLRARVLCTFWTQPIGRALGSCAARLDVLRAPKGGLGALVNLVDSHNLSTAKGEDRWLQLLKAKITGAEQKAYDDPYIPNRTAVALLLREAGDFGLVKRSPCSATHFEQCADRAFPGDRRRHLSFLLAHYLSTRDWADFALDATPTGDSEGRAHASATVSTWRSADGQRYRTGHPDANPNGVFPGRWTAAIAPLPDDTRPQ